MISRTFVFLVLESSTLEVVNVSPHREKKLLHARTERCKELMDAERDPHARSLYNKFPI